MTGELGQNPHPFPQSKSAGSVINRCVLTDNWIEEFKSILVLQRCVIFANYA